jgi:hypothetical protein
LLQGKTKGKGPAVVCGERIAVTSVQEHGADAISEDADTTLCNPILAVGVNAAEGKGLIRGINGGPEFLGGKNTIVAVVMLDGNVVTLSEAFEGRGGSLGVDVVEPRGMIHEDCGNVVLLVFEFPGGLGDKPRGFGDELVHRDHTTRLELVLG